MHVHQTKRSRQCAWSPNHKFVGSGCWHRTVSIVWTAQTSHAQYIEVIHPPGCMAVWNSSKLSRHSSLGDHYLSCTYLPFFVFHFKNHTTYFHSENFDFITIFFKKNIVLFSMLPSCLVIFPHSPRNIVMSIVPFEFVMFYLQQKNNLFTIIIIIY